MNNYNNMNNNFSRSSAGDSAMRFNKRPRYGTNNSNNNLGGGGSNNSRFNHHNSPGYQYSPNRNNPMAGDCQQLQQQQQYDKGPRQFYGISPKRQNHKNHNNMSTQQLHNKQSPQYLRKSTISSGASTSSTTFNVPPPTTLELKQPHMLPPPVPAPNSQRPPPPLVPGMMESSNYFSFGYNSFYGNNFKPDLMTPSTSSGPQFGTSEAMSSYMWQTIKSTPPPSTLPQPPQQLPPPPPLPLKQPPEPPMPPPTMSNLNASLAGTSSTSAMSMSAKAENIKGNEDAQKSNTIVKMKTKRKAISLRFKSCKLWCEEDALLALKAEEINSKKMEKDTILIVRFPDPEITREMVKCYSPDIESVHFQLNFAPRFCLVHLKPGTDVEKTIDHLSKIPFGTGFLSVEIKQIPHRIHSTRPNEIDPYTLYVGNLPTYIACKKLKDHFPGASRIDIGFAQRMKYTRYAFIRFASVKQAIEAYNRAYDSEIDGRNLTIRFRRIPPLGEGNKDEGDSNVEHEVDHVADDINDDQQQQQHSLESEDVTENFSQNLNENLTQSNVTKEQNQNDKLPEGTNDEENVRVMNESNVDKTSVETLERNEAQNKATNESNLTETNSVTTPLTNATKDSSNKEQAANTLLLNIKPDPDLDPDDIVIRNNDITSPLPVDNENIKQEEQISMYEEFFEAPSQPAESTTDTVDNSTNHTQVCLPLSSADETETMTNLSTNSLEEFLQSCQRNQSQINEITEIPLKKRTKLANDTLAETIKKEPVEQNSSNAVQPTISNSEITTTVKQEPYQEEQESNISQRNTIKANSLGANKTVPTNQNTDILNNYSSNSLNTQIDSTNLDEDMVPPTALFFRNSTSQNTNQSCDYDEFYETRINNKTTLPLAANIKNEPLELNITKGNNNNTNITQNNLSSNILQHLSNRITTTNNAINNAIDEDDLVPPQNLLGSYCPVQSDIKCEMEHDDLFTISFNNKTNENEGNFWNSKSLEELKNKNGSMGNLNRGESVKGSEDDVIINSGSNTPPPNPLIANNLVSGNLFFRQQPDLVTFKSKHITPPFVRNETSTLMQHHDNLDKLYEQLDADSDSDL